MRSVESFLWDVWKSCSFSIFICICNLFHPSYLKKKKKKNLPSTKSMPGKSFSWSTNGPVQQYPTLWFCWEAPDWEEEQFSVNHPWTNKGRSCVCVCVHAAEHTELYGLIRKSPVHFHCGTAPLMEDGNVVGEYYQLAEKLCWGWSLDVRPLNLMGTWMLRLNRKQKRVGGAKTSTRKRFH